jgi:PAS domain S-box-containing protein
MTDRDPQAQAANEADASQLARARAEAALRESEARLRSLIEGIPQLVWQSRRDGYWTWASPQWTAFTGQSEPDSRDLGWLKSVHPDDRASVIQAWSEAERRGGLEVEHRLHHAGGARYRWVQTRASPLPGRDNGIIEWLGTSNDIDELRRTRDNLRISEQRFRLIVENATGYAIIITDENDVIREWLGGSEAIFGWSAKEAFGCPAAITFTPQDRAANEPQKEVVAAAREGAAPDVRWHQRKDGGQVFIEGTVTPLRNNDGSVRGYLKIGQDVSERQAAQEALEASERRMRTLVTGIPQLVFRSRSDGERTWGSPQWIAYAGMSLEDSLGLGWLNAVHPDDREATVAAWRDVCERGEYYAEHRILHAASGAYRWHQTRATPLRDEAGRILEWIGTSTDVEELRQLQRHQQILLAELQHRVRNTLGVVRSIARRTAELSASKEELADHLQGRLAAFARVQAALTRTPAGGVDLAALIEDELLAHAARESEMLTVKGPPVMLKARPAESLSLALHELATNAVKYGALSRDGGRLAIGWTVEQRNGGPWLRFGWEEGGMHLSPETPARRGFGMELLERSLPYELDAVTRIDFRPTGFAFTMELPLTKLVID